jgi:lipid-A-disaccharide synthase
VLAILPFEPAAYLRLGGPPCLYVGHPMIERIAELRPNVDEQRRRRSDPPLVLVLPGSRSSELRQLLPTFGTAIARVAERAGPLDLVLPTVPHLLTQIRENVAGWPLQPRIVSEPADKWAAFRAARAALAASGTVTLELALAAVPTVAAYRLSLIEELVFRAARTPEISTAILANLVIGENVVPEFLQRNCTADNIAEAVIPLLSDTPQRQRQVVAFQRLDSIMGIGTMSPSGKAAAIVLDTARQGRRDIGAVSAPALAC